MFVKSIWSFPLNLLNRFKANCFVLNIVYVLSRASNYIPDYWCPSNYVRFPLDVGSAFIALHFISRALQYTAVLRLVATILINLYHCIISYGFKRPVAADCVFAYLSIQTKHWPRLELQGADPAHLLPPVLACLQRYVFALGVLALKRACGSWGNCFVAPPLALCLCAHTKQLLDRK